MKVDLIAKIKRCIEKDYKHEDYDRVCKLSEFYEQIVTGDEQDELVISYKPSENAAQKKSRCEITKSKTPAICSQVASQYDYVKGANRIVDSIVYVDVKTSTEAINAVVSRFYGKESLQTYLETKQRHYSQLDPNAWLIVVMDKEAQKPSPITVESENAIDFKVKGGITEYLIVKEERDGVKYYFGYQAGESVTVIEQNSKTPAIEAVGTSYKFTTGNYTAYLETNGTTETPAIRFGYAPDDYTEGETYVGIFQPAAEEFKDLINQKSELDLSLAKHAFYKKWQFVDACTYRDPVHIHVRCNGGQLTSMNFGEAGGTCPSCHGSGHKQHTTSQDAIIVDKPTEDNPSTVKLADMEHYSQLPIDIVSIQIERVATISNQIPKYIFGVDLEKRSAGFATATEINNFLDSVYMTIYPFAEKISQNYKFCAMAAAQYMGVAEGLVVSHQYPKRFKMETVAELLVMLKDAQGSNASSEIIWNIERQIMEIQNSDNQFALDFAELKRRYKPFKELSKEERMMEIASLQPNDKYRILFSYQDVIFNRLLESNPNLLQLTKQVQDKLVNDAVNAFKAEMTPPPISFNTPA